MTDKVFALHVLPAGIGDALLLEYGRVGDVRLILVDGGVAKAADTVAAALAPRTDVELMVVTHIDNDHIAGMVKLLETGGDRLRFGDTWFNGFRHLPESPLESMGPVQGERLTTWLVDHDTAWNRAFHGRAVVAPPSGEPPTHVLPGGMRIRVLSPHHGQLFDLRRTWASVVAEGGLDPAAPVTEAPLAPAGRLERMGGLDVVALAARSTPSDDKEANGSSIAMLAEWAGRSCLLTGDAHADVLLATLDGWLGPDGTLAVDVFKLPHHGSKANVTDALMRRVKARVYVFSSSGEGNSQHPNDEAVARAIVHAPAGATLAFNYRTKRTEPWDDAALRAAHGYRTQYPAAGGTGVTIDLVGLPD